MELKDIRERIDQVDDQLLDLFIERMNLSKEVAIAKANTGAHLTNPQREREILAKVAEKCGDLELYGNRLYRDLFDLSKAYQLTFLDKDNELRKTVLAMRENREVALPESPVVACQGVEGAYSQLAGDKLFKRGNLMFMKTFEAVFDAVDKGLCEFGVLPIDNSTNGSVKQVYDLMMKKDFYIVAGTKLFVNHELLAKDGTNFDNLTAVYSHDQGLNQCKEFLNTLPKRVKIIPCDNTAMAAEFVSKSDEHVAAISSHNCADLYDLNILASNIANNQNNYTQFIVITKKPRLFEGANKISLMLTCPHKPGALFNIISKFNTIGVNLTKLESHPIPGEDFEFMFFFEIDASLMDDKVVDMLWSLEQASDYFQFLGNYAVL